MNGRVREIRQRELCRPRLNREWHDIVVGDQCSQELVRTLNDKLGINASSRNAATGVDVIGLPNDANLDDVEQFINEWLVGEEAIEHE